MDHSKEVVKNLYPRVPISVYAKWELECGDLHHLGEDCMHRWPITGIMLLFRENLVTWNSNAWELQTVMCIGH